MQTKFSKTYTNCDVCGQRIERRAPIIEFDMCNKCYDNYLRRTRKEQKKEAK